MIKIITINRKQILTESPNSYCLHLEHNRKLADAQCEWPNDTLDEEEKKESLLAKSKAEMVTWVNSMALGWFLNSRISVYLSVKEDSII